MFWIVLTLVAALRLGAALPMAIPRSERIGLAGLGLMGTMGWITFIGAWLVPGGAGPFWMPLWCIALALVAWLSKPAANPKFVWQDRHKIAAVGLGFLMIFPLVKALVPSDTTDWDSLAYHFAVPKIWMEQGQALYNPFIHHSNFPFMIDSLFLIGLNESEAVAKLQTVLLFGFGCLWLFGVVSRSFGGQAATLATLAYAGTPLVLWSGGTGYIDIAHGLYAAVALVMVAELVGGAPERGWRWMVAGLALGGAMASKFTGLQVALALLVVLSVAAAMRKLPRSDAKPFGIALAVALLIAAPWPIRNVINTGNPVYPFFYSVFGGRDWDKFRAEIYADEQQTFGVGRTERGRDITALPHALIGLAYQPGRYINPNQTQGGGFPMGSLGPVLLLGFLAAMASLRGHPQRAVLVGASAVLILQWFLLSQQVRYFSALLPAWAWLLASFWPKQGVLRPVMGGLVALQALYCAGLLKVVQLDMNLLALTGRIDRQAYQEQVVPFAAVAREINAISPKPTVALYDEVFGYFLDVPYVWANPGHSTRIGYEPMQNGADLISGLRRQGITHVYVSLRLAGAPPRRELALALLANEPPPAEWLQQMDQDLRTRWQKHLVEAAQSGLLEVVPLSEQNQNQGVLLRIQE